VNVDIPRESPFYDLGLKPSPVATAGRSKLVMDAAKPL
jgi:hypothetical protein